MLDDVDVAADDVKDVSIDKSDVIDDLDVDKTNVNVAADDVKDVSRQCTCKGGTATSTNGNNGCLHTTAC